MQYRSTNPEGKARGMRIVLTTSVLLIQQSQRIWICCQHMQFQWLQFSWARLNASCSLLITQSSPPPPSQKKKKERNPDTLYYLLENFTGTILLRCGQAT